MLLALLTLAGAGACGRTTQPCESCPSAALAGSAGAGGATAGAGGTGNSAGQPNTGGLPVVECRLGGIEAPLIRYSALDLERSLDAILGPGPSLEPDWSARADLAGNRSVSFDFVSDLRAAALPRIEAYAIDEAALSICEAEVQGRTSCVDAWIAERGLQLYRRPLSAEQVAGYVAQFREQSLAARPAAAARSVLLSMVLSPYFVFRIELGTKLTSTLAAPPPGIPPAPKPLPPGSRLGAYEVAARLSHFLARRAPDTTLLAAVAEGTFQSREGHLAQAERLLQSPQTLDAQVRLHLEALRLDGSRSASVALDPGIDRLMLEQSAAVIAHVLARSGSFTDLLTSSRQPLNRPLAEHYGITSTAGENLELVELEPTLYSGVLGQGAWLSRHPTPTLRGIGVLDELLCSPPPPPPLE